MRQLVISLCLVLAACANADEEDRKKNDSKYLWERNLCNIDTNTAPLQCFCDSVVPGNATNAQCWVFTELIKEHNLWSMFSFQPHIKKLDVTVRPGGQFTIVPMEGLEHLAELETLKIKYASITDIRPFTFSSLKALREVYMTRNQVVNLERQAFVHLPNLTRLTLDENRIAELHRDVFADLPALNKLSFVQNNISVIHDGAFKSLASLVQLDVSNNYVSVLTRDTFAGLGGLNNLDMSFNRISMIGDLTFAELWSLEVLLIDSNLIEMVSMRAFAGLTNLKRLSLSNNRLTRLSQSLFTDATSISALDLSSNALDTLTVDTVAPILHNFNEEGSNLVIENNKFLCDCRVQWMHSLHDTTKNEKIRNALEEVTCQLQGMKFDYENTLEQPTAAPPVLKSKSSEYEEDEVSDEDDDYIHDQRQRATEPQVVNKPNPHLMHLFQTLREGLPCPVDMQTTTMEIVTEEPVTAANYPFYAAKANEKTPTISIVTSTLLLLYCT